VTPRRRSRAFAKEVGALDADVPMGAWTLSMRVTDAFRNVQVTGALTACAGVLALVLSAIGVFGLLAFAVNQRRRELAIRATLGAEPRDLARLVVGRSLRLTAIGVAIGLVAAIQAARLLTSMLYGVQPNDPLTLLVACGAIAIVAVIATWLPMRRAASIDPNSLLRES
jgi:putative ABC transport system permease protein